MGIVIVIKQYHTKPQTKLWIPKKILMPSITRLIELYIHISPYKTIPNHNKIFTVVNASIMYYIKLKCTCT